MFLSHRYGPIGVVVTVVIGVLASLLTGRTKGEDLDPRLLYPLFAKLAFFLPQSVRRKLWFGVPFDRLNVDSEVQPPSYRLNSMKIATIQSEDCPPSPSIIITPASPEYPPRVPQSDTVRRKLNQQTE